MPGHTEVGTGTQAARQRAADQTHERARVAAAGFLTRPEPLQKAPGSAQRAAGKSAPAVYPAGELARQVYSVEFVVNEIQKVGGE